MGRVGCLILVDLLSTKSWNFPILVGFLPNFEVVDILPNMVRLKAGLWLVYQSRVRWSPCWEHVEAFRVPWFHPWQSSSKIIIFQWLIFFVKHDLYQKTNKFSIADKVWKKWSAPSQAANHKGRWTTAVELSTSWCSVGPEMVAS